VINIAWIVLVILMQIVALLFLLECQKMIGA